jgi:hypothetical protein
MAKKIKIENSLFDRAKTAAEAAGYSSVEEFITHLIEQGIEQAGSDDTDQQVSDQLRGLGYID